MGASSRKVKDSALESRHERSHISRLGSVRAAATAQECSRACTLAVCADPAAAAARRRARDGRAAAHARAYPTEPRLDRLSPRAQRLRALPPLPPLVVRRWAALSPCGSPCAAARRAQRPAARSASASAASGGSGGLPQLTTSPLVVDRSRRPLLAFVLDRLPCVACGCQCRVIAGRHRLER